MADDRFDRDGQTPGDGSDVDADWIDVDLPAGPETRQAIVGVDPVYQDFLRSPYDPLYGARAGGRLTGDVVRRPPRRGWMRLVAYVLAMSLLTYAVVVLAGLASDAASLASERGAFQAAPSLLTAVVLGVSGALLLWRLLRDRHSG